MQHKKDTNVSAAKTETPDPKPKAKTSTGESAEKPQGINNTFAGSAVTTTLPDTPASTEKTINLADAKITVPAAAVEGATGTSQAAQALSAADQAAHDANEASFPQRAMDASIGLIKVEGVDFRYIGVSPMRDKFEPKTPSGYPISNENSNFTPLVLVPFDISVRVRDPESGEYYYPQPGTTSWEGVSLNDNPLVPKEGDSDAAKARLEALHALRGISA